MVTRLGEHVYWLNFTGVNAYLVEHNGAITVVDTGFPWHASRLLAAITSVGKELDAVERILLTHYDVDHVGGLGRMDSIDAPVYIGRPDEPYLSGESKPSLRTQKGCFQRAVGWWCSSPSQPIEPVDDGDDIGPFTAYRTPGHTPGHTVYVDESLGVAFLGDVVVEYNGELRPAPWVICQDHGQVKADVISLAEQLPAFEVACPGHGVPFVEGGRDRLAACASAVRAQS